MSAFLAGILAFPTVILTSLLVLVFAYWIFVLLGAMDVDILGSGDGLLEGGADSAAEGVFEGATEGVADGAAEGVFEGATEGVADGAAEGIFEGTADGAADGMVEGAAEGAGEGLEGAESSGGFLVSFISFFRLRSAPITVSLSIWILTWWALSYLAMQSTGTLELSVVVRGLAVLVLTGAAALFLASFLVRPLAPIFKTHTAASRSSLVAGECTIRTGTVDHEFGQAEYEDGAGASHIIDVRCEPPNTLRRGDKALILDYDDDLEAFVVEPIDRLWALSNQSGQESVDLESTEPDESTAET